MKSKKKTRARRKITAGERKERFRASYEHLNRIINSLGDPVFVKNREHAWVLLNDAYCRFMGYKREELIGKSDYDFFPRDEAEVFWNKDEIVFNTGEPNINEEKFTDAKGVTHTILTKKVMYTVGESEEFIVGVITDITRLKDKEEEILYQKTLLESVNEVAQNGLVMVDQRGEVIIYNRAFTDMWHIPDDVLATRSYYKFLQEIVEQVENSSMLLDNVERIMKDKEDKHRGEIVLREGRSVDWYTAPIRRGKAYNGRV